jgi:Protein of unknown function (DUF3530)
MRVRVFFFVFVLFSSSAVAQDYEREKRWAVEVVPNLVVGEAVQIRLSAQREFLGIFTKADFTKKAILLVHGSGVHPDHGVIGILRTSLADLGYSTLSIQMPVLNAESDADGYPAVFPEAAARIQAGADWLAVKGYTRPVLLSHSMGSRMADAYHRGGSSAPFSAWISLGITSDFGGMGNVKVPVFDVYGENDFPAVLRANHDRLRAIDGIAGSRQAMIPKADHYYTGREQALVAGIAGFFGSLP